jgi:hypothetical protein
LLQTQQQQQQTYGQDTSPLPITKQKSLAIKRLITLAIKDHSM